MGCIRVDKITEYLCDPLQRALKVGSGGGGWGGGGDSRLSPPLPPEAGDDTFAKTKHGEAPLGRR